MSKSELQSWLGGGEMGKLIGSMDWDRTPLGPIESWPQSLRTTVSLCLASNFPISLAWGPKHVQIYNDGYWPICGEKHPRALGQDFSECWASAWPVIGEAFERALAGQASFLENQRMFLDRNGYLEETFFTFSFSPIRDETGIAGLFHPVTETTDRMLSERRTRALRDVAARAGNLGTVAAACVAAAHTLSDCRRDLPFVIFYLLDEHSREARLNACAGLSMQSPASPAVVDLVADSVADQAEYLAPVWPFAEVARSGTAQHVRDLEARFGPVTCAEYSESVKEALVLPISPPGCERPIGFLVAGISSRLPFNEAYRGFFDLLAAGITTGVANARAHEDERKRTEALAEIDRAKMAFFSNVSHEFRTPLTLILGPLEDELAELSNPLPPARRANLEAAHRNGLRLLKLVNTLLDFSSLQAGRTRASFRPTDLAAVTADIASVFRSAIEKAGLTYTVECPALREPIYIDAEMWEKIVLNLISNALKHTFEGGIGIALRWNDDHPELVVADSGVGIPQAELPHLFERFHRVSGAKSRTHEGTGIGLALVRELVSLHCGTVRADSEEGKGTTFTIALRAGAAHLPADQLGLSQPRDSTASQSPCLDEAARWLPAATAPSGASSWPTSEPHSQHFDPQKRRPRVLWADDNADMRSYVTRLLSAQYDVLSVADGLSALAAAREGQPDLVLTDIMMPGLDGIGLLSSLRSEPSTRAIPVILLSARAGEEAAVGGLLAGADDYVVKPFTARELLARIHTHLELSRVRGEQAALLDQANKELEAFSYSVAHDLRAPLRAIAGFSKILLEDYANKFDPEGAEHLHRICAGVEKMSDLINDLLQLAGVSRVSTRRELLSMTGLAKAVVSDLRKGEPCRNLAIEIADGISAFGDARLVKIVLVNLLGNAWKFTSKRSDARIAFGCESKLGEAVFFARDNGAGFDMAHAGRLFSPFQRLHTRDEFEGTGIGLAIVQRIVSRHGGRIWVEAAPEKGATFYFTLGKTR